MVTASYGHYGQRAARIRPDRICRIRLPASDLVSFFQRRPGSYCSKLTRIRSEWPGQVLCKRILSGNKLLCKNHWARFWQNATGPLPFPTFRLGCVLPQTGRIILCKTSLDSTGFWLTMSGLGKTDPVRKSMLHFKTITRFYFDYNVLYVNMFQEALFLSSSSLTSSPSPSSSSSSSSPPPSSSSSSQ